MLWSGVGGRGSCYPDPPDANYDSRAPQKFTGKERDAETGLDYFGARYYSGAQGRFTSVDPDNAGALEDDPQSWNAYAYGRNNPLKYTDPDGLMYRLCTTSGSCIDNYSDSDFYWNFQSNPSIYLSGSGSIFADGQYIGYFIHLSDDPWYVDLKNDASNLMRYGSEEIQRKKEESWYQKNYASWLVANAADFIWPSGASDAALAMVGGSLGKASGKILSAPARKILRNIEHLAGETVGEAILSRGGLRSTVNRAGHYATKTVGETAEALAHNKSDVQARTAIKMVKQAEAKANKYGSSK